MAMCLSLLAFGDAVVASDDLADVFANLSLPVPTSTLIVACHGFGCNYRTEIVLTTADRARLNTIMAAGRATPAQERYAVANAVVWLDRRIGVAAGTTHRIAEAGARQSGDPGQMDCIDISANNTSLFVVLDRLHLLHFHHVQAPYSGGYHMLPHTTAVLGENKTGLEWAFDNWTHKYGDQPDVLTLAQWNAR